MKRLLVFLILAIALVLGAAPAVLAGGTAAPPQSPAAALSAQIQAVMQTPDMPILAVQCVVLKHGQVVYVGNFGPRYVDNEDPDNNLPVTTDTKYRIASISKMVAAIGVMQQVEKGRIELDADVSQYLGFTFRNPNYPDARITTRMLLSHLSSLRDGDFYSFPATDSLRDYLAPDGEYYDPSRWEGPISGADTSPGHYFSYQNLNYGVLATILESVTQQRFDRYMRKHVLQPLGCAGSYDVRDFTQAELDKVGVLYRQMDADGVWDPTGPWYPQVDDYRGVYPPPPAGSDTYVPGTNATWQSPQGGLRISALDLTKVERMFMNGGVFNCHRLLQAATVRLMFKPAWTYRDERRHPGLVREVGARRADPQERPRGGRPAAAHAQQPALDGPPRRGLRHDQQRPLRPPHRRRLRLLLRRHGRRPVRALERLRAGVLQLRLGDRAGDLRELLQQVVEQEDDDSDRRRKGGHALGRVAPLSLVPAGACTTVAIHTALMDRREVGPHDLRRANRSAIPRMGDADSAVQFALKRGVAARSCPYDPRIRPMR